MSQAQTQMAPPRASGRWRLQVVHRTTFRYNGPVRSSYNEARLTPENSTRQTTLRSKVEIEPGATAFPYRDYWGCTVTAFDLHSPHSELTVTGTSTVEAGPDLAGHDRVGWHALATAEVRDQFGELLVPTPLTAMDDDVVAEAREAVGDARPREAGALLCRFVGERME
jgi:transglutaminase-like putative cysteine protease